MYYPLFLLVLLRLQCWCNIILTTWPEEAVPLNPNHVPKSSALYCEKGILFSLMTIKAYVSAAVNNSTAQPRREMCLHLALM